MDRLSKSCPPQMARKSAMASRRSTRSATSRVHFGISERFDVEELKAANANPGVNFVECDACGSSFPRSGGANGLQIIQTSKLNWLCMSCFWKDAPKVNCNPEMTNVLNATALAAEVNQNVPGREPLKPLPNGMSTATPPYVSEVAAKRSQSPAVSRRYSQSPTRRSDENGFRSWCDSAKLRSESLCRELQDDVAMQRPSTMGGATTTRPRSTRTSKRFPGVAARDHESIMRDSEPEYGMRRSGYASPRVSQRRAGDVPLREGIPGVRGRGLPPRPTLQGDNLNGSVRVVRGPSPAQDLGDDRDADVATLPRTLSRPSLTPRRVPLSSQSPPPSRCVEASTQQASMRRPMPQTSSHRFRMPAETSNCSEHRRQHSSPSPLPTSTAHAESRRHPSFSPMPRLQREVERTPSMSPSPASSRLCSAPMVVPRYAFSSRPSVTNQYAAAGRPCAVRVPSAGLSQPTW